VGYLHNTYSTVSIGPGCVNTGAVMHEVLHTLGFFHEHNRPDRDNFVTIHFDNIMPGTSIYIMFKLTSSVYNNYNLNGTQNYVINKLINWLLAFLDNKWETSRFLSIMLNFVNVHQIAGQTVFTSVLLCALSPGQKKICAK